MDKQEAEKARHLFGKLSKCEFDQRAIAEGVGAANLGRAAMLVSANTVMAELLHKRIEKQARGWRLKATREGAVWKFQGGGTLAVDVLPNAQGADT